MSKFYISFVQDLSNFFYLCPNFFGFSWNLDKSMSNICPNFVQYLIFSQAFKLCLVPVQCLAMSNFCPIFVQRAGISVYVTVCPKFVQFLSMSREREKEETSWRAICLRYLYVHRIITGTEKIHVPPAAVGEVGGGALAFLPHLHSTHVHHEHVLNCVMARQGWMDDCNSNSAFSAARPPQNNIETRITFLLAM